MTAATDPDDGQVLRPRWSRRLLGIVGVVQIVVGLGVSIVGFAAGLPLLRAFAPLPVALLGTWLLRISSRQGIAVDRHGLTARRGDGDHAPWPRVASIEGGRGRIPVAVLTDGDRVPLTETGADGARLHALLLAAMAEHPEAGTQQPRTGRGRPPPLGT